MPTPGTGSTPVNTPASVAANNGDRNFLAAFLLTMSFGGTGLHQLYLGRTTQAWIRFVMYLSIILTLVSVIWGVVDFFKVYLGRKDGEGKQLTGTARDFKAAKIIFWIYVTLMILYIVGVIIFVSLGMAASNSLQNDTNYLQMST